MYTVGQLVYDKWSLLDYYYFYIMTTFTMTLTTDVFHKYHVEIGKSEKLCISIRLGEDIVFGSVMVVVPCCLFVSI